MIDKTNIKTTDWLTKGMTDEQIQKAKDKAIKQADKELARIEKKEKKKSIRAYRKMHRRHRKELVKLAKETREWGWGWLDEFVLTQIKHMHEYFSADNNVWQTDETRLPIVEQLKHVLDLYDEVDNKLYEIYPTVTDEGGQNYRKREERRQELYEEIYSYIGKYIQWWWD